MFVSPMLLHKVDNPIDNDSDYIAELKLDGIRLILSKFDNKTTLYTRHNNDVTSIFPEIAALSIPNGTVLDGELIAIDEEGKPDFEMIMSRFKSKKLKDSIRIQYAVFDVLYFGGKSVMSLPLLERKEILSRFSFNDLLAQVQYTRGHSDIFFNLVEEQGLEGIVLKKDTSIYKKNHRSQNWLKLINYKYDEVYISGLRKKEFGVTLSNHEGKYVGLMEFMPPQARKALYKTFTQHVTKEDDNFISIEPYLKCKVKYRNLTKNNLLRIPSFVEWLEK